MVDKIKNIPKKMLDWWNKFSKKQKIAMASIIGIVIMAIVILSVVLSQPKMITLITCETTAESSQVKELLDDEGISNEVSNDGLVIKVNQKDESNAVILLGKNSIPAQDYNLDSVFDGGFSSTESDKEKKYKEYLEEKIASTLSSADSVEAAEVHLDIPSDDGTIISQNEDTYASIMLTLSSEVDESQAQGFAKFVSTAVGNDGTDSITILDTSGNVLFAGDDSSSSAGNASNQLEVKGKAESMVKKEVKDVLIGTSVYDNVEVGLNLAMNFSTTNTTDHQYYVADDRTEGYKDSESTYNQETTGGTAGTPGTDTNDDDTTYVTEDGSTSSSTTEETDTDYALNEKVTITDDPAGTIDPENSSISVVANTYHIYNEDELQASGQLDNMSFDEFTAANSDKVKLNVDQDFYTMVSDATGINEANISIVAYEVPFFVESQNEGLTVSKIIQYILAGLILLMLGFVVFKSTRPAEVVEMAPELSVEALLESTRDNEELEDIGFSDKSETRIQIEKFVDENPEAVASLLRNWLNEDWE